jgi:hypothetical protein
MVLHRASIASLVLGSLMFGCGDDADANWAWCKDCELGAQMELLGIEGAVDCGSVTHPYFFEATDSGIDEELQCVRDALASGMPFNLVVELPGVDSTVQTGWVGREDGTFWVLGYDSNVCGSATCTEECGPVVARVLCMAPQQADRPTQLSGCESPLADSETICAPPGKQL